MIVDEDEEEKEPLSQQLAMRIEAAKDGIGSDSFNDLIKFLEDTILPFIKENENG